MEEEEGSRRDWKGGSYEGSRERAARGPLLRQSPAQTARRPRPPFPEAGTHTLTRPPEQPESKKARAEVGPHRAVALSTGLLGGTKGLGWGGTPHPKADAEASEDAEGLGEARA